MCACRPFTVKPGPGDKPMIEGALTAHVGVPVITSCYWSLRLLGIYARALLSGL